MTKTVAFVTTQCCCDRIIYAARGLAKKTCTDLFVAGVMDAEYALDPEAVDYLFDLSKKNQATMRLIFSEDKTATMREVIAGLDVQHIVTGEPSNGNSVLYTLWKDFAEKQFYTVDADGVLFEAVNKKHFHIA